MLQLGDKKISELYLGEKKVSEVYLGEKQIRPVGKKWEVNKDTWIYLPYSNDKNDHSGNNRSTTSSLSVSNARAYAYWSQYTLLGGFSGLYFTIHSRIKLNHTWGYQIWFRYSDGSGNDISRCYLTWYWTVRININNTSYDTWYTAKSDKEYLYSIVIAQNKVAFYVDWEKKFEQAIGWVQRVTNAQMCLFNRRYSPNEWLNGAIREVILESKARTPEEVKAYYDGTKAIFERANNYAFTPTADTIYYNKFKSENWSGRYVDTGVAFESGSFTVSLWAKAAREFSYGNGWFWTLIGKYRWWAGGSQEAFILGVSCRGHDSQLAGLWLRDLNRLESDDDIEHTRMNPGEWHQIVATYDANTKILSFATDGVVRITKNKNFWAYGNHSFYVGAINDVNWITGYFDWNIEEVILEKKAWSAEKIVDYYNSTKWQFWL